MSASAPPDQQQRLSFDGAVTKMSHHLSTVYFAFDDLRAQHRAELLEATRRLRERNAELARRLSEAAGDCVGLCPQEIMEEEEFFETMPCVLPERMSHPLGSVRSSPLVCGALDGREPWQGRTSEPPSVEIIMSYPLARSSTDERRCSDLMVDCGMSVMNSARSALAKKNAGDKAHMNDEVNADRENSEHPLPVISVSRGSSMVRTCSEPRKAMRASMQGDTVLNRQPIEMEKVWERPRPTPMRVEQRSSQGGDTRYMFDVFAKANFSNMIARSRLTDETSNSVLQRLVMEPSSLFSMIWSMMEVLLLSYDLIVIPVLVADMEPPESPFSIFMTYLSVIFWSADIPISFFKGFVTRTGDLEMRMGHIAVHYAKTRLVYDMMLLGIEWVNFGVQALAEASDVASSGRLLRLLRFSRLLKVSKMQRLLQGLIQRVRSNVVLTMLGMSKVVAFILLANHMLACGWYAVATLASSQDSVVSLLNMSFGERYSSCLHWSLSQLGFGTTNIYPDTTWERMYAACVAVISLMLLGFLLGSVVTGMTRLQMLLKVQREQEEQLRDYLCRHKVSWPLRNRIWIFLRKHTKTEKRHVLEANVELITKLPKAVFCELRAEVFIPILTVHPFFGTYAVSMADKFAMHTLVEKYAVNEFALDVEHELFAEGEVALCMYFCVQGKLLYRLAAGRHNPGSDPLFSKEPSNFGAVGSNNKRDSATATWVMMEKDEVAVVGSGEWLCEAALWLRWVHVGSAIAKTHCEVVSLIAEKFQTIMHTHLPEAQKYARLFLQYAKDHRDVISDSFVDVSCLRSMAHDIFEPPIAFEVGSCFPTHNELSGRNDWRPSTRRHWQKVWTTPWKEGHYLNRSALLATMTTDMKHDSIMMYQTLFSQNHTELLVRKKSWLTEEELMLHDQRVCFLKRLLLCFAACRVAYATESNGLRTQPWAFPLASVLSHGSRVLLRLDGVPWRDFVNFLIFGDQNRWNWEANGVPAPLYVRRAASHGVRLDPRTSELQECKLKNLQAFGNNHLGMDIPVGGLGNPTPSNTSKHGTLFVGPGGVPFRRARRKLGKPEYIKDIQHGHLYMRWDDFGSKTASVLMSKEMLPGCSMNQEPSHQGNTETLVEGAQSNGMAGTDGVINGSSLQSLAGPVGSISTSSCAEFREEGAGVIGQDGGQTAHWMRRLVLSSRTRSEIQSGRRSFSGLLSMGAFEWTPVPHMRCIEDLDSVLTHHEAHDLVNNEEAKHRLLHLASKGQELALEANSRGGLRCHGVLVHLVIELARDEEQPQSQRRILVHQSATAGVPLSGPDDDNAHSDGEPALAPATLRDLRVLTVLCCHHESWTSAVARYCQQVFSLSDAALERLMESCQSEGEETFNYRCGPAPTICHHHQAACQSNSVPLVYDALRLKSRLYERDRALFGNFFQNNFVTMEHSCELHGFAGRAPELGVISREWRWMSATEMSRNTIAGFARPDQAVSLRFARETKRVSSLLIGIESSAPMKEDFFGNTHGVDAKSKDRSAMGKPKWRAYGKGGQEVPADLGAIRVCVNEASFDYFKLVCKAAGTLAPRSLETASAEDREAEHQLFKDLLQDSDEAAERILAKFIERKGGEACVLSRSEDNNTTTASRSLDPKLFSM